MFWKKSENVVREENEVAKLKAAITSLENERVDLKREVEDLKSKRKIEEEEIKHLVKIKDEKREIEYEKREMALERKKNKAIADVKDEYRDKVEQNLENRNTELKEMYTEILSIVPKVEAFVSHRSK